MNVGIFYMLIGVALLVWGISLYLRQRARIKSSLSAEGVVIELVQRVVGNEYTQVKTPEGVKFEKKYQYRPVIRFRTQAGRTVKFCPSLSMRPAPYQVGDRVNVLYLPEDPKRAQINRFMYLWFYVIMVISFGFLAFGMGLLFWMIQ
jgi:hypothetical protein